MDGSLEHPREKNPERPLIRFLRNIVVVLLGIALLVTAFVQYRRRESVASRLSAREALLSRQNTALRELSLEAERGTLLDFESILVVVDQSLVQNMLEAVTPMNAEIGGGFHIRVDTVEASFGDGVALVDMKGTARVGEAPVGAPVTVFASIDTVAVDAASGLLRCNVSILAVEAENAEALGRNDPVGRLTEALTEGGLDALLGPLEIPVRLENTLGIPAVDSKRLQIAAETLPLTVVAQKIRVFGGKLWVFVDAALSGPVVAPPTGARP